MIIYRSFHYYNIVETLLVDHYIFIKRHYTILLGYDRNWTGRILAPTVHIFLECAFRSLAFDNRPTALPCKPCSSR